MEALDMLNTLIGVVLVCFVLSLIVSAMMEWVAQLRGIALAQVTVRLLGLEKAPEKDKEIAANDVDSKAAVHAFFDQALQQDSTRKPSYVPTRSKTLRREMALHVQDHSISGYSQILANTHVVGG